MKKRKKECINPFDVCQTTENSNVKCQRKTQRWPNLALIDCEAMKLHAQQLSLLLYKSWNVLHKRKTNNNHPVDNSSKGKPNKMRKQQTLTSSTEYKLHLAWEQWDGKRVETANETKISEKIEPVFRAALTFAFAVE